MESQSSIIKQYEAIYRCAFKDYTITVKDERDNLEDYEYRLMHDSKNKSLYYLFKRRKKICQELVKNKSYETKEAIELFEYLNKEIAKFLDI